MVTLQFTPINIAHVATEKQQAVLASYFDKNPVSLEEFPRLFAPAETKVSMGELIDSPVNDLSEQDTIDEKRVLGYIISPTATNFPFIKVRRFIRPIEVGVLNDGRIVVLGGRHRVNLYLTVATLSGLDINSAEFRSIEIPVFQTIYSPEYIISSNKSRPIPKAEVVTITAASKGVDVNDASAILTGLTEKTVTPTEVFTLLALNTLDETEKLPSLVKELTRATFGQIFGSAAAIISKNTAYKHSVKDEEWVAKTFGILADAKVIKLQDEDGEEYQTIVYGFNRLDKALDQAKRDGVTNLARAATKIATILVDSVKKFPKPVPATVKSSSKVKEVVDAAARRSEEVISEEVEVTV